METAFDLIALVVVVTAVGGMARRWGLPGPLLLVVVGVAASYIGRYEGVELDPELVLIGLLPPLLYSAAVRTSLLDLRHDVGPIASLSVGAVVATTLAVGYVAWWVLPIPLAAGFALGAVVAPPDAVAASAIARRVGLPRRILTVLEGESLVNDATALVCLSTAIAALEGGITAPEISRDFALSAVGGTVVGVLVAFVVVKVRTRVDDTLTQTSISLVTPFSAYLLAEEIHASGVLAVVVTGLIVGQAATQVQSAPSRLFERSNWATIAFLLESAVFLLIGLQVRPIVTAVGRSEVSGGRIALAAVAVVVTVVAVRFAWVALTRGVLRRTSAPGIVPAEGDTEGRAAARVDGAGSSFGWGAATVVSWAGMRGVVTLAAAFVLPVDTPLREVLVLLALVVTAGTLLGQGATLPALIRRLGLAAPDHQEDALLAAEVFQRASLAGRARLDELLVEEAASTPAGGPGVAGGLDAVAERLRTRSSDLADARWERLGGDVETPSQAYARLRVAMLAAERAEVLRIRATSSVPHEVLEEVLTALDVEESVLEQAGTSSTADRERDLEAPAREPGCDHLAGADTVPDASTPDGCEECLRDGTTWVHLRLCLTCGHVGCCDSSQHRHATAHHASSGHPVIRSFEPGEAWRWCFVDDVLG